MENAKYHWILLEEKIRGIRKSLKERDIALKLQRKEYKRRLAALNHEAEQLKSMQSTYVRQETYDINNENIKKAIREQSDEIRKLSDWQSNFQGRFYIVGLIWPVIAAVIVAFLAKLLK